MSLVCLFGFVVWPFVESSAFEQLLRGKICAVLTRPLLRCTHRPLHHRSNGIGYLTVFCCQAAGSAVCTTYYAAFLSIIDVKDATVSGRRARQLFARMLVRHKCVCPLQECDRSTQHT